jgi:asparagine synthase (glutamine-hydrolysing)
MPPLAVDRPLVLDATQAIEYLRRRGLTYCGRPGKLETVSRMVQQLEARGIPGVFVEAGVAMGGSAIVIVAAKKPGRELRLFDVFAMLPPPSANDDERSHEVYKEFVEGRVTGPVNRNYVDHAQDLLSYTRENMRAVGIEPDEQGVVFVKGLYEDTLHVEEPIAFAHIDCDWYDSVKLCIERLSGRLSPGGIMLFDDYSSFEGCRRAVDEWLRADARFRVVHADWTLAVERIAAA